MITTLSNTRRRRRKRKITQAPAKPILITLAERAGVALTLVFDQPVTLVGTPAYTCGAATVVSAEMDGDSAVMFTFSGALAAGTPVVIPFQDPAIRNASGGFVTPNQILPVAG